MSTLRKSLILSLSLAFVAIVVQSQSALAQYGPGTTSLRTPLLPSADSTAPNGVAPEGDPPPPGDFGGPEGVTPGQFGGPTLLPSVSRNPANHLNYPGTDIGYPGGEYYPGEYGPNTWAPPPPENPAADPGQIRAPRDFHRPPAREVSINPGGGIPGGASRQRWGGQETHDYGRYKNVGTQTCDFGQQMNGQTSEDGPYPQFSGTVTQDLHGRRLPWRNGMTQIQTIAPY